MMLDKLFKWSTAGDDRSVYHPEPVDMAEIAPLSAKAVAGMKQRARQQITQLADKLLPAEAEPEQKAMMRRIIRARLRNRRSIKTRDMQKFGDMSFDQLTLEARSEEREAPLSLSDTKRYRRMAVEQTARDVPRFDERYPEIFADADAHRIYIPLLPGVGQAGDYLSERHMRIAHWLMDHGYTDIDYRGGYCTDERKNTIKIGKVLRQAEVSRLAHDFEHDPVRKHDASKLAIVISRHPYDIARMSTGRGWKSCMEVGGSYHHHVRSDLHQGTLVAYLISNNDPDINDPLSRILLKPLRNDEGQTILQVGNAYGLHSPEFSGTLKRFVEQTVNLEAETGTYRMAPGIYNDGENSAQYRVSKAAMADAQTFLKERGLRHVKMGERIWAWGNINLSSQGLTSLPDLSNVVLYGDFSAADNQLTDLKGFPRKVSGSVNLRRNQLRCLHELAGKTFESVTVSENLLQTLEGGPKRVRRYFNCHENPLDSLAGIPRFDSHSITPLGSYNRAADIPRTKLEAKRRDPRAPSA